MYHLARSSRVLTVCGPTLAPPPCAAFGLPRGQYKLRNLFSGAFDRTPDVSPLPIMVPLHTKWQLEATAALLAAAKKPVLIVASQATLFDGRARSADEVCTSRCMS